MQHGHYEKVGWDNYIASIKGSDDPVVHWIADEFSSGTGVFADQRFRFLMQGFLIQETYFDVTFNTALLAYSGGVTSMIRSSALASKAPLTNFPAGNNVGNTVGNVVGSSTASKMASRQLATSTSSLAGKAGRAMVYGAAAGAAAQFTGIDQLLGDGFSNAVEDLFGESAVAHGLGGVAVNSLAVGVPLVLSAPRLGIHSLRTLFVYGALGAGGNNLRVYLMTLCELGAAASESGKSFDPFSYETMKQFNKTSAGSSLYIGAALLGARRMGFGFAAGMELSDAKQSLSEAFSQYRQNQKFTPLMLRMISTALDSGDSAAGALLADVNAHKKLKAWWDKTVASAAGIRPHEVDEMVASDEGAEQLAELLNDRRNETPIYQFPLPGYPIDLEAQAYMVPVLLFPGLAGTVLPFPNLVLRPTGTDGPLSPVVAMDSDGEPGGFANRGNQPSNSPALSASGGAGGPQPPYRDDSSVPDDANSSGLATSTAVSRQQGNYAGVYHDHREHAGIEVSQAVGRQVVINLDHAADREGLDQHRATLYLEDENDVLPSGAHSLTYSIDNNVLRYSIHLPPLLRGRGINQVFIADILRRHPDVQAVQTQLVDMNAGAFFVDFSGYRGPERRQRIDRFMSSFPYQQNLAAAWDGIFSVGMDSEAAITLRQRIIDTYRASTADGQAMNQFGFDHIVLLWVDLENMRVVVHNSHQTATTNNSPIAVFVSPEVATDPRSYELRADGTVVVVGANTITDNLDDLVNPSSGTGLTRFFNDARQHGFLRTVVDRIQAIRRSPSTQEVGPSITEQYREDLNRWIDNRSLILHDDEYQRLERASSLLQRSLSYIESIAIIEAHRIGVGEEGADGSPAGIDNYTDAQKKRKARILKEAGIPPNERRILFENGIVGSVGDGGHTLPPPDPDDYPDIDYQALFQAQDVKVDSRLSEALGAPTGIELHPKPVVSKPNHFEVTMTVDTESDALDGATYSISYRVNDGTLSYQIQLNHPMLRGKGIGKLFFYDVLRRHPEITVLRETLMKMYAGTFFVGISEGVHGIHHERVEAYMNDPSVASTVNNIFLAKADNARSPLAVAVLRNKILDTYLNHTPQGVMHHRTGFNNLQTLVLFPESSNIYYKTLKGPGTGHKQVRVIIIDARGDKEKYIELTPDGRKLTVGEFNIQDVFVDGIIDEDVERIRFAEEHLGRTLDGRERGAIQAAHLVGEGEDGADGHPARVGNYTDEQLERKARILELAGFSRRERRLLIELGVVGGRGETDADGARRDSDGESPQLFGFSGDLPGPFSIFDQEPTVVRLTSFDEGVFNANAAQPATSYSATFWRTLADLENSFGRHFTKYLDMLDGTLNPTLLTGGGLGIYGIELAMRGFPVNMINAQDFYYELIERTIDSPDFADMVTMESAIYGDHFVEVAGVPVEALNRLATVLGVDFPAVIAPPAYREVIAMAHVEAEPEVWVVLPDTSIEAMVDSFKQFFAQISEAYQALSRVDSNFSFTHGLVEHTLDGDNHTMLIIDFLDAFSYSQDRIDLLGRYHRALQEFGRAYIHVGLCADLVVLDPSRDQTMFEDIIADADNPTVPLPIYLARRYEDYFTLMPGHERDPDTTPETLWSSLIMERHPGHVDLGAMLRDQLEVADSLAVVTAGHHSEAVPFTIFRERP